MKYAPPLIHPGVDPVTKGRVLYLTERRWRAWHRWRNLSKSRKTRKHRRRALRHIRQSSRFEARLFDLIYAPWLQ